MGLRPFSMVLVGTLSAVLRLGLGKVEALSRMLEILTTNINWCNDALWMSCSQAGTIYVKAFYVQRHTFSFKHWYT